MTVGREKQLLSRDEYESKGSELIDNSELLDLRTAHFLLRDHPNRGHRRVRRMMRWERVSTMLRHDGVVADRVQMRSITCARRLYTGQRSS